MQKDISKYEADSLTHLYASLSFCEENELPTREIKAAIRHIEIKREYFQEQRELAEKKSRIIAKYGNQAKKNMVSQFCGKGGVNEYFFSENSEA